MSGEETAVLLCGVTFTVIGAASVALWTYLAVVTLQGRARRCGDLPGFVPLLGGAAAGVLMGNVGFFGGLLLSALLIADVYFDAYRDPPEWLAVALAAVPAGLVLGPGLTLWGLTRQWQSLEDSLPAAGGGALDEPFRESGVTASARDDGPARAEEN